MRSIQNTAFGLDYNCSSFDQCILTQIHKISLLVDNILFVYREEHLVCLQSGTFFTERTILFVYREKHFVCLQRGTFCLFTLKKILHVYRDGHLDYLQRNIWFVYREEHCLLQRGTYCLFTEIGIVCLQRETLFVYRDEHLVCLQRGTNELKKYLRSRIEPDVVDSVKSLGLKDTTGTSGIIGGLGDGIDPYSMASTKTLDYRWVL